MTLFLIGIHGSYIVGTLIEQFITEKFDPSGYIEYSNALFSIGGILNLVFLVLSIFLLKWLRRHGIKIILIVVDRIIPVIYQVVRIRPPQFSNSVLK